MDWKRKLKFIHELLIPKNDRKCEAIPHCGKDCLNEETHIPHLKRRFPKYVKFCEICRKYNRKYRSLSKNND